MCVVYLRKKKSTMGRWAVKYRIPLILTSFLPFIVGKEVSRREGIYGIFGKWNAVVSILSLNYWIFNTHSLKVLDVVNATLAITTHLGYVIFYRRPYDRFTVIYLGMGCSGIFCFYKSQTEKNHRKWRAVAYHTTFHIIGNLANYILYRYCANGAVE